MKARTDPCVWRTILPTLFLLLSVICTSSVYASADTNRHVVIISIDGLRPDFLPARENVGRLPDPGRLARSRMLREESHFDLPVAHLSSARFDYHGGDTRPPRHYWKRYLCPDDRGRRSRILVCLRSEGTGVVGCRAQRRPYRRCRLLAVQRGLRVDRMESA